MVKKYLPLICKITTLLSVFSVIYACNGQQNAAPTYRAEDESSLTILIPRIISKSLDPDPESRIRPALEALEELLGFHIDVILTDEVYLGANISSFYDFVATEGADMGVDLIISRTNAGGVAYSTTRSMTNMIDTSVDGLIEKGFLTQFSDVLLSGYPPLLRKMNHSPTMSNDYRYDGEIFGLPWASLGPQIGVWLIRRSSRIASGVPPVTSMTDILEYLPVMAGSENGRTRYLNPADWSLVELVNHTLELDLGVCFIPFSPLELTEFHESVNLYRRSDGELASIWEVPDDRLLRVLDASARIFDAGMFSGSALKFIGGHSEDWVQQLQDGDWDIAYVSLVDYRLLHSEDSKRFRSVITDVLQDGDIEVFSAYENLSKIAFSPMALGYWHILSSADSVFESLKFLDFLNSDVWTHITTIGVEDMHWRRSGENEYRRIDATPETDAVIAAFRSLRSFFGGAMLNTGLPRPYDVTGEVNMLVDLYESAASKIENIDAYHPADESDSGRRQELRSATRSLYTKGGNALLDCAPSLRGWTADQIERYR